MLEGDPCSCFELNKNHPVNFTLQTDRLLLREFTIEDAPFIIELVNSPGWLRFIGDKNVHSLEQAKQYLLKGPIKSYHENGFGLSLVLRKLDEKPIGMCGLIKRNFLEYADIGFAFLPKFQRYGYAHEVAAATLQHSKDQLKMEKVFAVVMSTNERSRNLLEKIGLRYIKPTQFPGEKEELMLYST